MCIKFRQAHAYTYKHIHTHACACFHLCLCTYVCIVLYLAFIVYVQMKHSNDCDKLLKAVKRGNFEEIDAIMRQLMPSKNRKLYSDASHLVLQLTVCYGHASLVVPLLLQYKVQRKRIHSFVMYVFMYVCVYILGICSVS